ncbi:DUF1641 domain-containing protein [Caldiplasma sukawensis]
METENKQNEKDKVEEMLAEFLEDDSAIAGLLNLAKIMKDSGNIEFLQKLGEENIPGNPKSILSLFDRKEMHEGGINLFNLIVGLMASFSKEPSQSAVLSILYNSDQLWSAMIDGAKKPENFSLLRLFGILKDPEIAAGLTSVLNMLKVLGSILKNQEDVK